jgi:hypothetical protein
MRLAEISPLQGENPVREKPHACNGGVNGKGGYFSQVLIP